MYNEKVNIWSKSSFGSLMDIDKFVPIVSSMILSSGFGSLMDIDKFVHYDYYYSQRICFGSLMDIDKFVHNGFSAIFILQFRFSDGY